MFNPFQKISDRLFFGNTWKIKKKFTLTSENKTRNVSGVCASTLSLPVRRIVFLTRDKERDAQRRREKRNAAVPIPENICCLLDMAVTT
jgi:hypothetical protein